MNSQQNLFIIPFTTENDYKVNVEKILSLLKKNVDNNEIILTEGEHSYIHKVHDVYEYSKEFDLPHRYHNLIQGSINVKHIRRAKNIEECSNNFEPYKDLKYIVCIGTWAAGIVSLDFAEENPMINIIHIQGPVKSDMYKWDQVEALDRFEVDVNQLGDILNAQFQTG